ncbi:MAG TPA: pyridoxal-dependent decarboxylase [Gaiellaceae bacterium]|nr:pyridoxal-dependent decarboxylase [Gaiellaceae bacterium]
MHDRELFRQAADHAADFLETLETRPVRDQADVEELYASLGGPLPEDGLDDRAVLAALVEAADPGLVASQSGRYFGFVVGGSLPAATAADWLATAWDVNAGGWALGGAAMVVEEVARGWIAELLGLPSGVSAGFVTGCQMAHVTALAAARHHVLARVGWDVAADGLARAPRLRVVVGEKRHVTVDRALRLLGIGASSLVVVPADDQGRMRVEELPDLAGGPTIVCGKAGEVNTGSIDDLEAIADAVEGTGAWFHVDGAFGLWAAASPQLRHLVRGVERADSWATDCHKWLNVPYDSGIAFCAHPDAHRQAMAVTASYLVLQDDPLRRDALDWGPEFSRRARGFAVYAALRSLGRKGVADLVERCCAHAQLFAELLEASGAATVLNDVVLNQVLVRFGDGERTREVIRRVQEDGTCWLGGTEWQGEHAMRISVSNWRTTREDVERSAAAILAAAAMPA